MSRLPELAGTVPAWAWYAAGPAALIALLVGAYRRKPASQGDGKTPAATLFYIGALGSLVVSADTSWRFFREVLGITSVTERAVMFGVLEIVLIGCGLAMRRHVKTSPDGKPGRAQNLALLLLAFSAYAAFAMSPNFWAGLARVGWGPLLGLLALHEALGIEVHYGNLKPRGLLARVLAELRERALSLLGLGDDDRTAVTIRRDRAARRLARLVTSKPLIPAVHRLRVRRASFVSGVAHDPAARTLLLNELATLRHLDTLTGLTPPSPWTLPGKPQAAVVRPKPAPVALATVTPIVADKPDWLTDDMSAVDIVRRYIEENPDATAGDIHRATGLKADTVRKSRNRIIKGA